MRAGGRQDLALLPGSKQAPNLASLLWALPPASPAPSLPWGTGAPLGHGHLSEVPLSQMPPSAQLLPIELAPPHSSPISASLPPPAIHFPHPTPSSILWLHPYSATSPTHRLPSHLSSPPTPTTSPTSSLPFHTQSRTQHTSPLSFCPIPFHPLPTSAGKSSVWDKKAEVVACPLQLDSW